MRLQSCYMLAIRQKVSVCDGRTTDGRNIIARNEIVYNTGH